MSAVQRARKLLEAAGRQDFPQRLTDLEADVAMVLRLEEIYRQPKRELKSDLVAVMGSERTYREPKRAELSSQEEFFWGRQQDIEFATAFREFGIDTDSLEPAEAASRITGRSIRRELAKALDEWAALRRRGRNNPSWKKLVEIASQADQTSRAIAAGRPCCAAIARPWNSSRTRFRSVGCRRRTCGCSAIT